MYTLASFESRVLKVTKAYNVAVYADVVMAYWSCHYAHTVITRDCTWHRLGSPLPDAVGSGKAGSWRPELNLAPIDVY